MAKKKRKALLPKRIAGVKVPKAVRRGRFGELLASQTGQALIAQAVMAAGAIGAARKVGADDAPRPAAAAPRDANAVLARALGEAARAFAAALGVQRPSAAPAAKGDWAHAPEPADDGGSKKKPDAFPSPVG